MYNILYLFNEPIQRGNISIIFKLKDSSFEYASKMSLDKAMIPKSELSAAKQIQYRFPSLIQPLNSSLTHYSLALRYRGGTGTITQWIDNWNYWNDIGHTIPLHAGNRRAPEKSLNSEKISIFLKYSK